MNFIIQNSGFQRRVNGSWHMDSADVMERDSIKGLLELFIFDAGTRFYPRAQDLKPGDDRKAGEAAISNGFPDFFVDGAHPVAAGALVLAVMDSSEMVLLDPCQYERLARGAPFGDEFVLVLDFNAHNLLQDITRVKVIHA